MSDMRIKVRTEELYEAADDLLASVSNTQSTFEEIEGIIGNMREYWEGKGHNTMSRSYKSRSDDYNAIFKAIDEHVQKLGEIAGVYLSAERSNADSADALSGDVIV